MKASCCIQLQHGLANALPSSDCSRRRAILLMPSTRNVAINIQQATQMATGCCASSNHHAHEDSSRQLIGQQAPTMPVPISMPVKPLDSAHLSCVCDAGFLCPKGTCLCGANTCYTSQYGCKNGGLTQNPTDNGGFCPSTNSTNSIVNYGVGNTASTASGSATSYTVNPADIVGDIYVSGLLHQVTLSGLTPNTQYTYTVSSC